SGRSRGRAHRRAGPGAAPTAGGRAGGTPRRRASAATLLAHAHADLDRRADEAEVLAQLALDEAAVAVLDEPGREDDEARRAAVGLRREEDARLLAPPHRVRVRGGELAEEGVELAGGDAGVPAAQRGIQRLDEAVDVPAGLGRDVDARR